jgi:hypothetical protein
MRDRATPWNGWVAFGMTLLAVLYSVALLVEILVLPEFRGGHTLFEYGGSGTLLIFGQPLVVTLVVWALLNRHCKTGSHTAGTIAEIVASLYIAYSILGGFTISAGAFPAACFLLAAVLLTPRGEPTPSPSPGHRA